MFKKYRNAQVANLILATLSEILIRNVKIDPRVNMSECSFTSIKVSPDLKVATCYFTPSVISKSSKEDLLFALEESKHQIRKMIAQKLKLRYAPELRFFHDNGVNNAKKIESILAQIDS